MKHSFKLIINTQRKRQDGTAALSFQVILDKVKTTIPLNLYWPVAHFDPKSGTILKKDKLDTQHEGYVREIERKRGEINEVFIWARLARVELTIESFKNELAHSHSRSDFVAFYERTVKEREENGLIKASSAKAQRDSIRALKQFRKVIAFSEISKKTLDDYRLWLHNKAHLKQNSVWNKLKDVRTYLNLAREAGHQFEYPFGKGQFKMPKMQSRVEHLSEEEFLAMKHYFDSDQLDESHKIALRVFLFSCYTGMRISDITVISWRDVENNILVFEPKKQQIGMMKVVKVPLSTTAKSLIVSQKGRLIDTQTEPAMNRILKAIAGKLEIKKDISLHWARHTFATRFLRHGGRIEVLQQLLGHSDIKTTMIYVHVDEDRLIKEINLLT